MTGSPSDPHQAESPALRTWLLTRGALLVAAAVFGAGIFNYTGRSPLHGALFAVGTMSVSVALQGAGLLWEARKRRRDR